MKRPNMKIVTRQLLALILTFSFLASVGFAAGDKEKAKEHFNAGLTSAQAGKIEEAIMGYEAAIAEDPTFIDAYINLGAIHFEKNNYQKALEMYRTVTEKDPKNVLALSNLANVEYELKKYVEAEGHLNAAIALAPKDASLYKDLGKILFAKRDYEETVKALGKCHENGGGNHLTQYMMGKAYQKLDKPSDAIACFDKSVQLEKKNYNSYFALGQVYLSQGKYMNAANYFDRALKSSPTKHLAAYNYAVAVESQDPEDYAKNIEAWEKFLRLAKNNPKARASNEIAEAENHVKQLKEALKQKNLQ